MNAEGCYRLQGFCICCTKDQKAALSLKHLCFSSAWNSGPIEQEKCIASRHLSSIYYGRGSGMNYLESEDISLLEKNEGFGCNYCIAHREFCKSWKPTIASEHSHLYSTGLKIVQF